MCDERIVVAHALDRTAQILSDGFAEQGHATGPVDV